MSRSSKFYKPTVGAPSVNDGEIAPEVMNLTAAAASSECQTALVEGPAAARTALAKHGASIPAELSQALETVGSYATNEDDGRTLLHEAVINGDAATVEALIVAADPELIDVADWDGAIPLDLATDDTCCDILKHHKAVYASITEDPTTLVAASLAHCAAFSASGELLPATALSLRAHHFDPAFRWAPPAARTAVVAWARSVFVAQLAPDIEPFGILLDDCAGDVLEFFEVTHNESELIAKHCSSPEAQDWVRAVISAAIMAKATADLVPAAFKGDLATVLDCLSKKANIETKVHKFTALICASASGRTATVKALLKEGADKDAKDGDGETALMKASQGGHTATVELLLGAGADKEAKDKCNSSTALMMASENGHTATVKLLLEAGANKEAEDVFGWTALILAIQKGHTATVKVLLEAGADKGAKKNGMTALDWAKGEGRTEVVALLAR